MAVRRVPYRAVVQQRGRERAQHRLDCGCARRHAYSLPRQRPSSRAVLLRSAYRGSAPNAARPHRRARLGGARTGRTTRPPSRRAPRVPPYVPRFGCAPIRISALAPRRCARHPCAPYRIAARTTVSSGSAIRSRSAGVTACAAATAAAVSSVCACVCAPADVAPLGGSPPLDAPTASAAARTRANAAAMATSR